MGSCEEGGGEGVEKEVKKYPKRREEPNRNQRSQRKGKE